MSLDNKNISSQKSLKQRLLALAPYFGGHRAYWTLAILGIVISALTEAAVPALLKPLLDEGFIEGALSIWAVPLAIIALFALRGAAHFLSQYALATISGRGMLQLRQQLFQTMLKADLGLFSKQSASQLANTIVYEVQIGTQMLVTAFLNFGRDTFTVVAMLGYLLYLNWQLTLIVAILVPVVSLIMRTMSKRLYKLAQNTQRTTDELAYVVEENVMARQMVRLHGAQELQEQRFKNLSSQLTRLAIKTTSTSAATMPLAQMCAAIALSSVIAIALYQSRSAQEGTITVGSFISFISAMLMLIQPLRRLTDITAAITRALAALERGLDLINTTSPEKDPPANPEKQEKPNPAGNIEFQNINLEYPSAESQLALNNINLKIKAGSVVALVGASGAGKTSLINLLPRFAKQDSGTIKIDGIDIDQIPLKELRGQIALVAQDVIMLNDSVLANIALGIAKEDIDEAKAIECLKHANLLEHINKLPQGIHTKLGHNASELSGGQRQRLAIARAFYKDAPILLLDEATSALDTQSERQVQQAMNSIMQGRTTLVIAHRLSTIEHADQIIVMNAGKIVEKGTHKELLEKGEHYKKLQAGF